MATQDFLVELGTEELPPKALPTLSAALTEEFVRQLDEAGLNHGEVESFAAPRRLAVLVRGLDDKQAEQVNRLVDLLDDHDDVKEVFSNAEFPA